MEHLDAGAIFACPVGLPKQRYATPPRISAGPGDAGLACRAASSAALPHALPATDQLPPPAARVPVFYAPSARLLVSASLVVQLPSWRRAGSSCLCRRAIGAQISLAGLEGR